MGGKIYKQRRASQEYFSLNNKIDNFLVTHLQNPIEEELIKSANNLHSEKESLDKEYVYVIPEEKFHWVAKELVHGKPEQGKSHEDQTNKQREKERKIANDMAKQLEGIINSVKTSQVLISMQWL